MNPPRIAPDPNWKLAHRLARLIPNHPHPNRATAVHRWALAVQRALRGAS